MRPASSSRALRAVVSAAALTVVSSAVTAQAPPKVSEQILFHGRVKAEVLERTPVEHERYLHSRRLNAHRLDAEDVTLYVDAPLSERERDELAAQGVEVHPEIYVPALPRHPYGFHPAVLPYDKIDVVAAHPRIRRVASAEVRSLPANDIATELAKIDDVQAGLFEGTPRDGTGVKLAIADSGLDWSHADIPTPTEMFDMIDGTTVANWGLSVFNEVTDHGTHVTGIAVGSGQLSGGVYRGAAPGASLHFYKIGGDCSSQAAKVDQIEALNRAAFKGCRVFSMSYGSAGTYRDGSGSFQQAVDAAFDQGMVSFVSSGNAADNGKHYRIVMALDHTSGAINVIVDNTEEATPRTDPFSVKLLWIDSLTFDENMSLSCDNLGVGESLVEDWSDMSPRGTEGRQYDITPNVAAGASKTYQLRVTNSAISGPVPTVHMFASGADTTFQFPSVETTVGGGVADRAISVGAWTHRNSWTSASGMPFATGETLDTLASFSSQGPRIDGVRKPDLCAYGTSVIAPLDIGGFDCPACSPPGCGGSFPNPNSVIDNDGLPGGAANYIIKSGTSMACPMAAGAACLILEEDPSISAQDVYDLMTAGATQAETPDNAAGFGVIRMDNSYTFAQSGITWVDFAWAGVMTGSYLQPYSTLAAGVSVSPVGGTVKMKPGSTSETVTVVGDRSLRSYGGSAVVGQ